MICMSPLSLYLFFFNDTSTTEIYTLSLHDALPIFEMAATETITSIILIKLIRVSLGTVRHPRRFKIDDADRKSGSAGMPRPISYAVFCLKKKKKKKPRKDQIEKLNHMQSHTRKLLR